MLHFELNFRPAQEYYRLLWTSLDWLYPPKCFGCDIIGTRWCQSCQDQLNRIIAPICPQCGQPTKSDVQCKGCAQRSPAFSQMRSLARFDGTLKSAFYKLKYQGDLGIGESLSRPLIDYYHDLGWEPDIVTPIPIGTKRKPERGYNQAALIGLPFALGAGLPYRPGALVRVKETQSQVGLSARDRRINLQQAFEAPQKSVFGKTVLVIDDITTTGATLEDAARALRRTGATEVLCLTVARAVLGNARTT